MEEELGPRSDDTARSWLEFNFKSINRIPKASHTAYTNATREKLMFEPKGK